MMPDEFRGGHSNARSDKRGEPRRRLKRPYVRPKISRQDLEHAVKGGGASGLDPLGSRAVPPGDYPS